MDFPPNTNDRRNFFLKRAADADKQAASAETEEIARTWRLIAGSWRTLADQVDKMNSP